MVQRSGYKEIVLAIESSCDDTGASVCADGKIVSNIVANQDVHEKYGGVVPELASRAHQQHIVPVVQEALKRADVKKEQLSAIGFTKGPGLIGALLVGTSFAKGVALALKIPLVSVNHLQAHVFACFIESPPVFPFICLLASGGHTLIIRVDDYFQMNVIGRTLDDAAGEAFDKAAKMLGLTYPGGALIDRNAALGVPVFTFPEPQVAGLDYSFSGLKTSFLYFLAKQTKNNPLFVQENLYSLCASFQHRIVTFLLAKLDRACEMEGINSVALAGGVAANSYLRQELYALSQKRGWNLTVPRFEYCTDNAAMIAITAYHKLERGLIAEQDEEPLSRMPV